MAIIIGKIKCYFCGSKDGLLHSVHEHGIYGEAGKRLFYHDQCLKIIEVDPEKFGHKLIDKALHIHELKKQCVKFNSKIADKFKAKIETLNRNHFERMMPNQY